MIFKVLELVVAEQTCNLNICEAKAGSLVGKPQRLQALGQNELHTVRLSLKDKLINHSTQLTMAMHASDPNTWGAEVDLTSSREPQYGEGTGSTESSLWLINSPLSRLSGERHASESTAPVSSWGESPVDLTSFHQQPPRTLFSALSDFPVTHL